MLKPAAPTDSIWYTCEVNKFIVTHLVQNIPAYLTAEGTLPATESCPGPNQSSPQSRRLCYVYKIKFIIIFRSTPIPPPPQVVFSLQVCILKCCMNEFFISP
jgi:hypothetical protein